MAELSPIEKLDIILKFLNGDNEYQHSVKNVTDSISIKLNSPEVHKILDKLVRDGYAEMRNVPYERPIIKEDTVKTSEYTFIVTFEGQLFLQKGGYAQQEIDNNLSQANLEIDVRTRKRNERLTSIGSVVAAIGAVGILLWEIGKAIYNHCYQH